MRYHLLRSGRAIGVASLLLLSAIQADAHHGPSHVAHSAPVPPIYAAAPYGPHVNHAHAAPPFQWGWFGAEHFYPRVQWGRDYNGELMRWSKHRRY